MLLILAAVAINLTIGENGIFTRAQEATIEHEKASAREKIELVLADAVVEKKFNPEYNENEFLDNFIKRSLPNVGIKENEIELNGFAFELDRSVPQLGEYIGETTGLRINEIKVTNKTSNSISVEVITSNAEVETYTYSYKKDGEGEEAWKEAGKDSSNTFIFSNLEANVEYNIKVEAIDNEGNEAEKTISASTEVASTIETILEEGDFVNYVDGTGATRKCLVLYGPENAKYSIYGIQVISMECVEDLVLGSNADGQFNANRDLYNDGINYLNNATQKYLNATYAKSVRCVGSVPDNPSYDVAGMYYSSLSYAAPYNGTFKDLDDNYTTDWEQMKALNVAYPGKDYWLASRLAYGDSGMTVFGMKKGTNQGYDSGPSAGEICWIHNSVGEIANTRTNGLRPVFTLKPEIKITGGDGSSETPYELGV